MKPRNLLAAALGLWTAGGCVIPPGGQVDETTPEARAISLLRREVPAWSRENGCFSCHNNGDAARALYAAAKKGHRLPPSVLQDTTAWLVRPARWEQNKGDPGFSDQRLANIQFAAALLAAIETGHTGASIPIREAAWKLAADQAADGSWPIDAGNAVGSPATYGTTLATLMAWRVLRFASASGTEVAMRQAEQWLRESPVNSVLAAATLMRAFVRDESGTARRQREQCLNLLQRAQSPDGGWGPYADSPPETFDTAVVLLGLAELRGTPATDEMIRRGRRFLIAQQQSDGGWPATTRPPRGTSYAQRISTAGWATLALLATQE